MFGRSHRTIRCIVSVIRTVQEHAPSTDFTVPISCFYNSCEIDTKAEKTIHTKMYLKHGKFYRYKLLHGARHTSFAEFARADRDIIVDALHFLLLRTTNLRLRLPYYYTYKNPHDMYVHTIHTSVPAVPAESS